jgi:hypothetical protein
LTLKVLKQNRFDSTVGSGRPWQSTPFVQRFTIAAEPGRSPAQSELAVTR